MKSFELKAKLFEQNINVTKEAEKILNSLSKIWRMNDYITCTGVTLKFLDQYATVDIKDDGSSELTLIGKDGKLFITDGKDVMVETEAIVPPEYMKDVLRIEGKEICAYCNTYTDRIRIQMISGCTNKCKFCNAKEFKYEFNTISGLEEALGIALGQQDVRHILMSSGSVKDEDLEKLTEMYEYFAKKYSPKYEVDLMMTPRGFTSYYDESQYRDYIQHLKDIGVNGLSINIEIYNEEKLAYFCPEKHKIGRERYFKFLETAVEIFGKNKVRSLIIVGLEPMEDTIAGVEALAKIGVNPVLSPLFPYGEANTKPNAERFITARKLAEEVCKKYDIELGPLCKPCQHNTL